MISADTLILIGQVCAVIIGGCATLMVVAITVLIIAELIRRIRPD